MAGPSKKDPQEAARRASARAEAGKTKHAKPPAKPKGVVVSTDDLWWGVCNDETGLSWLGIKLLNLLYVHDIQRSVDLSWTPGGGYLKEDSTRQMVVDLQKGLRPQLEQQRDALTIEAYRQDTSKDDRRRAEAAKKNTMPRSSAFPTSTASTTSRP